jgi:hypothetical protein
MNRDFHPIAPPFLLSFPGQNCCCCSFMLRFSLSGSTAEEDRVPLAISASAAAAEAAAVCLLFFLRKVEHWDDFKFFPPSGKWRWRRDKVCCLQSINTALSGQERSMTEYDTCHSCHKYQSHASFVVKCVIGEAF